MVSEIQIENKGGNSSQKIKNNLKKTKNVLFSIGVLGQWLFVGYIVAIYGAIAWNGNYEEINEHLPHGIMEGDPIGNFMLGVHLFLAAIITFGGPLQFFDSIRNRFPVFHRWLGRGYFVTAFLISGAGLYMIYTRGAHGGTVMLLGNTLNAVLIMTFSILAWRSAMNRNFVAHKRWAIRAFLMVSGVWFFRLGYGIWILATGFTAIGTNADLTGPFDRFLSFGHSLVPLLILELYFLAKASSNLKFKKSMTAFLAFLSLVLTVGIIMAAVIFWVPAF